VKGTTPLSVGTTPRSLPLPPAPAPEVVQPHADLLKLSESNQGDSARSFPSSSRSGTRSGESSPRSGNSSAENTPRGGKKHTHRRLSVEENITHDGIDYHGAETPRQLKPMIRRFSQSNISEDDVDDEQLTSKVKDAEEWGVQVDKAALAHLPFVLSRPCRIAFALLPHFEEISRLPASDSCVSAASRKLNVD
jgi:hypothetical protein